MAAPKPPKPPAPSGNAPGGGGGSMRPVVRGGRSGGRPTLPSGPPVAPAPGGGGQREKPVGYGLKGRPFYDLNNYLKSKAYKSGRTRPVGNGNPMPLQAAQRLPGATQTFPHTGAAAAPGTADQHLDQVRQGIAQNPAGGM